MPFEKEIALKDCAYKYAICNRIKKYTLRDTTFSQNRVGNYELVRLLENIPNSGDGFQLKIIINESLTGFKLNITDKSGLHVVNIFKSEKHKMIQEKFYFLMDGLVERQIFTKKQI